MAKGNYHVVRRSNGSWAVRRAGSARASSTHKTQGEAVRSATRAAKKQNGQVFIHRTNGRIRDVNSYKNNGAVLDNAD